MLEILLILSALCRGPVVCQVSVHGTDRKAFYEMKVCHDTPRHIVQGKRWSCKRYKIQLDGSAYMEEIG